MTNEIKIHCAHDRLVDVTDLVPNPRNPNRHGDAQVALLAKIIRHTGWRSPVVVSKRSGFIVAGHGRLEAGKLQGCKAVPVNFQDFADEATEWAHLAADNRIAELAETDGAMLKDLLIELDSATADFDMDLSGFTKDELERVINAFPEEPITPEAARATLCDRFIVPPFSVLDARQGYWQDRKRAWLALGIKSEIGRGGGVTWGESPEVTEKGLN